MGTKLVIGPGVCVIIYQWRGEWVQQREFTTGQSQWRKAAVEVRLEILWRRWYQQSETTRQLGPCANQRVATKGRGYRVWVAR